MADLCRLILWTLVDLMRARATLEAEIWALRQQINVLRRAAPRRQSFSIFDRTGSQGLRCVGDRQAGYDHPLASRGFQSVLALEVETSWWPTNCTAGDTQAYPRDEHC